jgi:6-phosphogluconolactonase
MCFHPLANVAYIVCELSGRLLVCSRDPDTGSLAVQEDVDTLPPPGVSGKRDDDNDEGKKDPWSAAVVVHPTGRAVYVSDRNHDVVTTFRTSPNGSILSPACFVPSGGRMPRDLSVDPSGRWLLVANQDSDTITVYRLEEETLLPVLNSAKSFPCGTPSCICFRTLQT